MNITCENCLDGVLVKACHGPEPEVLVTKVTLRGPRPHGGSYTTVESDPNLRTLLEAGWTVHRRWDVSVDNEGRPYVVREHDLR
jgi:hypothetical protein